jgi:hypothetical protein
MNDKIIKTFHTDQISADLWNSYLNNFNLVFKKEFDLKHFQNKYKSHNKNSYHSFLIANETDVVGALSIIPMKYNIDGLRRNIGLVVDLFVLSEFRNDPLVILKLYLELKKLIKKSEISIIVAVPNINSVSYFTNILKFKKIGNLKYWIFPVNVGNIKLNKNKLINYLSNLISRINLALNYPLSILVNSSRNNFKISLDLNSNFIKNRFSGPYKIYNKNNYQIYYRIFIEDGVNIAYLIHFEYKNKTNYISLWHAVNFIKKNEEIDLILYVGPLPFFQLLLFKVPKFLEPKNLPFIYENINFASHNIDLINDFKNWNFGLINYDVR